MSINAAAEPFVERRKRPARREAYEIYQRGHHEWQTLQRHRMQDGLQLLSRAIELDPSLIAARVDLVNLCIAQSFYGFMSPARCSRSCAPHGRLGIPPQVLITGVDWGREQRPGNRSVLSGGASTWYPASEPRFPGQPSVSVAKGYPDS